MPLDNVVITQLTGGTFTPLQARFGIVGLVGAGSEEGQANILREYTKVSDILAAHGPGGLYDAALAAAGNGASNFKVVHTATQAQETQLFVGDASQRVFTINGGTAATQQVANHPNLEVRVDATAVYAGAALTLGTDYIFDWSNNQIHMNLPPPVPTGADSLQVKFSTHLDTATTGTIALALAALEDAEINSVALAYMYRPSHAALLATHIATTQSDNRFRIAYINGEYNDATNILGTAAANGSKRTAFFANKSGFPGNPINDLDPANTSWAPFKDVASAVSGFAAQRQPWLSLQNQVIKQVNWVGQFTSTQIGSITSSGTLFGDSINILDDPRYLAGTDKVVKRGWVQDASVVFIDVQRTFDYVDFQIRAALANPALTGTLTVSLFDMEILYRTLNAILYDLFRDRAISNPADMFDTHGFAAIDIEVLNILRKNVNDRTDAEEAFVQGVQASREIDATISVDYQGSVHTYNIGLALV